MGTWMDGDGLYHEYGPQKAVAATAGDYLAYGETRLLEVDIDLTTLTATPVIQTDSVIFPAACIVEAVEIETTVAATGGTSFSVGLIGLDRSTVDSNTKFVAGVLLATHDALAEKTILTGGSTGAGTVIGTTATNPGYITAIAAGTYTAGKVKVRIRYRGVPPITQ